MSEDLIRRADALGAIERMKHRLMGKGLTYEFLIYMLNDLPSAEPKTGRWITDKYSIILCSKCGWCAPQIMTGCLAGRRLGYVKSNFCWHCGADMRGEQND